MAEQTSEAAVLFADVSGSTKLYETAGDQAAHEAIDRCVALMRAKTEAAKGTVINTIGDEVMSTFPSADAAADAAIEMQLAISELPPVGGIKIGIRVGFYFGPVVMRDGDVFGDVVNLASRLSHVAVKDQIITAREIVMRMAPMLKAATRRITAIPIKGKAAPVEIYELVWRQSEEATTMAATRSIYRPPKNAELRLKLHDAEIVLTEERPAVSMGRDQGADLVIKDRTASRGHGKIERRLDKFVLIDHSANGTFVTIEGEREIVLRREEFLLRGRGTIAFGQSKSTANDILEFFYE